MHIAELSSADARKRGVDVPSDIPDSEIVRVPLPCPYQSLEEYDEAVTRADALMGKQ